MATEKPDATTHAAAPVDAVSESNGRYITPFLLAMLALWFWAASYWFRTGDLVGFAVRGYLGLMLGVGVGGYVALPSKMRPYARKVVMLFVGALLLAVALVTDHGNMQFEGLVFALLSGLAPFVVIHFFIAKLAGPLLFGRLWCGWACWYGMVFDMLPYPFSYYRRDRRLSSLRYLHFAISVGAVAGLWFLAGIHATTGPRGATWFLIGLAFYYLGGIVLALVLKDNRAFCKYICPISVPMKEVARFSLVKMGGTASECPDGCETCIEMCPMNIRVKDYLTAGRRVLSTECVMCLTCAHVCPKQYVKPTIGIDVGGREIWDHDPSRGNKETMPDVGW